MIYDVMIQLMQYTNNLLVISNMWPILSWNQTLSSDSLPFSDKRIERCSTWLWRVSCDRKFNKFHINNHIRKYEFERRQKFRQGFKLVSTKYIDPLKQTNDPFETRFRSFIAWIFYSDCNHADHVILGFIKTRKVMIHDLRFTSKFNTQKNPNFS